MNNITCEQTDRYSLYNGDCVEVISQFPKNSIDFSVFSPPFANTYIYSDDVRDMGNCQNSDGFFEQYGYLTEQLYRVIKPGRLIAVHCKQLVKYKSRDGAAGWQDFRGDLIRHYEQYGFQYHSEVVIWTDPVLEMQKTKTQRLLYCQLRKDASHTGIGMPEYLLIFRKWGTDEEEQNMEKIKHYRSLKEAEENGGDETQVMELETWQKYASPVWFDIRHTDCLNSKGAKDADDEKHICPLPLQIAQRAIELWTNPNEIVLTPFLGIGSEAYEALKLGRRAIGVELKESYYKQAVANCQSVCDDGQVKLEDFV